MKAFQIVLVLVCAGLGFGIVNSLINAARAPKQLKDDQLEDRGQP